MENEDLFISMLRFAKKQLELKNNVLYDDLLLYLNENGHKNVGKDNAALKALFTRIFQEGRIFGPISEPHSGVSYTLLPEYYFHLISYDQLQQSKLEFKKAEEDSNEAKKYAEQSIKIANRTLYITIGFSIVSIIVSIICGNCF